MTTNIFNLFFRLVRGYAIRGTVIGFSCLVALHSASAQDDTNPLGSLIFESVSLDAGPVSPSPGAVPSDSPTAGNQLQDDITVTDAGRAAGLDIEGYRQAISDSLEEGDLYSPTLAEQYETLGLLLYRAGNYEEAVDAFEDAIHIHKVNKGLFNLDQAKIVEHLIRAHVALGDFPSVDNHMHYLFYIQEKNLSEDDPRLIAAKTNWADWNVEAYTKGYREVFNNPISFQDSIDFAQRIDRSTGFEIPFRVNIPPPPSSSGAGENIPDSVEFTISARMPMLNSNAVMTTAAVTDYNLRSIPYALSSDIVVNQRLYEAENIYESLLDQLEKNDPGSLMEQQDLLKKLANVNFLLKKELDQYRNIRDQGSLAFNRVNQEYVSDATLLSDRRYVQTKNEFTDLVENIENSAKTTAEQKAQAYISLGDMHLSFERPQRAFDAYGKAYEILREAGLGDSEAVNAITPEPDITVPSYATHHYSREFFGVPGDTQIPYKGYIDVEFSKDRYGKISGINVLAASENTLSPVRSALLDYLREQRFRPQLSNGEAVRQDNIKLRYYYYY